MIEKLKKALSYFTGEYGDIRYEKDRIVQINFKGKKLENISDSTVSGFHIRIINNGGLSKNSVTLEDMLPSAVIETSRVAKITSRYSEKIKFKVPPPIKDKYVVKPKDDPKNKTLEEKLELLRHYNELVLKNKKIQSTNLLYEEWVKDKVFINSNGSEIEKTEIICGIRGSIIAGEGNNLEDIRVSIGGSPEFSLLQNREDVFEKKIKIVVDLLYAEKVSPGVYKTVLDQSMAGLFIHEAFGHFSEADHLKDNPKLLEKFKLGTKIASDCLNVIDDPTIYGKPGFHIYDDEGIKSKKVVLIKNGMLTGRLHSMETAEAMNEELTGHNIAVGWDYTPIIRMSNIYIENGENDFDYILSMADNGIYVCGAKGGQTMGDEFSFGTQYGYKIKNGKISKLIKGINISGNLFITLKNITAVGNDLLFDEVGGCGKSDQINPQSGKGGPHILINNLVVG